MTALQTLFTFYGLGGGGAVPNAFIAIAPPSEPPIVQATFSLQPLIMQASSDKPKKNTQMLSLVKISFIVASPTFHGA